MKRVSFHTLGCKLNFAETATFQREFAAQGFSTVDAREESDVVVINTCSVTQNADRDARKAVRQALRTSPGAYVIVLGCYAQLQADEIASIDGVDLVLGNEEKFHIMDHADPRWRKSDTRIVVGDVAETQKFNVAYSSEGGGRTRAFLKVQDGCDYNCSYCTIPMARGASRSESIDATVAHARDILAQGFHEIVLSGVNVGDYGAGTESTLFNLLEALLALPGDFRLRVSSIEPNLLDDDIIALAAAHPKFAPHFHIPLQSGSDAVLRSMRRRYNTAMYRERVDAVLAAMPDAAIGVDVIVGMPGETEELFRESYTFLVDLPCAYLHVFNYSERPGTEASGFNVQVPPQERARRSSMLRTLGARKRRAFSQTQIGRTLQVLFESGDEEKGSTGFSENYVRVSVPFRPELENRILPVHCTAFDGEVLTGVPVTDAHAAEVAQSGEGVHAATTMNGATAL
ncbi:MAG: tRNA (N(6)-L-threonylcarbamoyladenosine(37)-C(2))-methylthiotransferase MtaB [Bacteroidetes bacterium]|nr:tRNA (N(6)-L-threonylcarbamoyladenosine(37)-C(2))-methylthiotransferase MtaB [Bacteroidota bacterium]